MSHRDRHHAGKPPLTAHPVEPDPADTDALMVPIEESNFATDNYRARLPVFDELPRVGRGSADPDRKPKPGPVARQTIRNQRVRKLRRLAHTVCFAISATIFGSVAVWLVVLAWVNADDPTPVQVRSVSPVLILAASAMLLLTIALFLMWRDGRPR